MILQLLDKQRRHLLIDVDTQRDFLLAGGSACTWNHSEVLLNIRRVMAWARHQNISIISTAEVRPNSNSDKTGYCIDGTNGQRKIRYTLLSDRASFPADGWNALPADLLRAHRQIILHKRCPDPFDEPRIERLLSEVKADEFILIGAGAEDAVKATALGLLHRGKNVMVVVDALGSHDRKEAKLAIRKMRAKGAKVVSTRNLAGTSHLRRVGACGCRNCRSMVGIGATAITTEH
ncbi:MAG: cysteine hydrolase family protein [Planctomycetota bacterium]|jgi:nicotinamidase-related amidase